MFLIKSHIFGSIRKIERARLDRMKNIIQLTKLFVKVGPIVFLVNGNFGCVLTLYMKLVSEFRKNNENYFEIFTRRSEIILVTNALKLPSFPLDIEI